MVSSGVVSNIRAEDGSIRYEYFLLMDDPETVLLIDSWRRQIWLSVLMATAIYFSYGSLYMVGSWRINNELYC